MRDEQQGAPGSYFAEKRSEWAGRAAGNLWDATRLADDMETDARFAALDLCGFWHGPTTSDVREILLPMASLYGWGPPIEVIADAVTIATDRCRSNRQATAALIGVGAVLLITLIQSLGSDNG